MAEPLHTEVSADEEVLEAALVLHVVDEGLLLGLLSVPEPIVERSNPAVLRSILAAVLRSIPAADLRNTLAADLRSIPAAVLRSILYAVLRNTVHADWSSTHLPVDDILLRVVASPVSFPRNDHPTIFSHVSKFQQRMRSDYVPVMIVLCVCERLQNISKKDFET